MKPLAMDNSGLRLQMHSSYVQQSCLATGPLLPGIVTMPEVLREIEFYVHPIWTAAVR